MLRSHLQLAADMVLAQLLQELTALVRQQVVEADAGTDEHLLYPWQGPEAAQEAWLTTTKAPRSYQEARFSPDCWLFFGKETAGLPLAFRERFRDRCIRLPMVSEARSLNLSNTVAVCVYEALRQNGFPGLQGTGEMAQG